jgi:tetratricopeptide (TPR) repeat protein
VLFAVVRPISAAVPPQVAACAEEPAKAVQIATPQIKVPSLKVRLADVGRKLAAVGQKVRSMVVARTSGEWYSRAMDLHRQGSYERAIEAFQKSIDAGQREGAASYNIACGYARLGDSDRAFEWLNKALDAGFDVGHMLDGDDDLESLRGDPRLAGLRRISRKLVARFDHMIENPPKSADPWYSIGKEMLREGDYDRSARAFRESAARSAKPGNSLYNTACALSRKGDSVGALAFLAKAIESGFDDTGLIARDDDLDAIRGEPRFRELQERAEGGRAQYSLGLARLRAEDFDAAAQAFSRATELDYRRAASLYNLACVESRRGDREKAFDYLDRAIDAGFDAARQLRSDDDLDNLRGDPRYPLAIRKADARAHAKMD